MGQASLIFATGLLYKIMHTLIISYSKKFSWNVPDSTVSTLQFHNTVAINTVFANQFMCMWSRNILISYYGNDHPRRPTIPINLTNTSYLFYFIILYHFQNIYLPLCWIIFSRRKIFSKIFKMMGEYYWLKLFCIWNFPHLVSHKGYLL